MKVEWVTLFSVFKLGLLSASSPLVLDQETIPIPRQDFSLPAMPLPTTPSRLTINCPLKFAQDNPLGSDHRALAEMCPVKVDYFDLSVLHRQTEKHPFHLDPRTIAHISLNRVFVGEKISLKGSFDLVNTLFAFNLSPLPKLAPNETLDLTPHKEMLIPPPATYSTFSPDAIATAEIDLECPDIEMKPQMGQFLSQKIKLTCVPSHLLKIPLVQMGASKEKALKSLSPILEPCALPQITPNSLPLGLGASTPCHIFQFTKGPLQTLGLESLTVISPNFDMNASINSEWFDHINLLGQSDALDRDHHYSEAQSQLAMADHPYLPKTNFTPKDLKLKDSHSNQAHLQIEGASFERPALKKDEIATDQEHLSPKMSPLLTEKVDIASVKVGETPSYGSLPFSPKTEKGHQSQTDATLKVANSDSASPKPLQTLPVQPDLDPILEVAAQHDVDATFSPSQMSPLALAVGAPLDSHPSASHAAKTHKPSREEALRPKFGRALSSVSDKGTTKCDELDAKASNHPTASLIFVAIPHPSTYPLKKLSLLSIDTFDSALFEVKAFPSYHEALVSPLSEEVAVCVVDVDPTIPFYNEVALAAIDRLSLERERHFKGSVPMSIVQESFKGLAPRYDLCRSLSTPFEDKFFVSDPLRSQARQVQPGFAPKEVDAPTSDTFAITLHGESRDYALITAQNSVAIAPYEAQTTRYFDERRFYSLNKSYRLLSDYYIDFPSTDDLNTNSLFNPFESYIEVAPDSDKGGYLFSCELKLPKVFDVAAAPQHYLFLVDRSKAVKAHRYDVFKRAVLRALPYIRPEDTFNVALFDSRIKYVSDLDLPNTQNARAQVKQFFTEEKHAGLFKTLNVSTLLSDVKFEMQKRDSLVNVVLLSSGDNLANMPEKRRFLKHMLNLDAPHVSIFATGCTDSGQNHPMHLISTFNGGEAMISPTNASYPRKFAGLIRRISHPIASNVHLTPIATEGTGEIECYTANHIDRPNIYKDNVYKLYGHIDKLEDFELYLQGTGSDEYLNISQMISFEKALHRGTGLKKEIAQKQSLPYYFTYINDGDLDVFEKAEALRNGNQNKRRRASRSHFDEP